VGVSASIEDKKEVVQSLTRSHHSFLWPFWSKVRTFWWGIWNLLCDLLILNPQTRPWKKKVYPQCEWEREYRGKRKKHLTCV